MPSGRAYISMRMRKLVAISLLVLSVVLVGCSGQAKTIENLKIAISSETNTIAKYSEFAERAMADSLPNVALLFKAVVTSELIHKQNYISELAKLGVDYSVAADSVVVGSTLANLYSAKAIEEYEVMSMCYEMEAVATKEGALSAAQVFSRSMVIEERHCDYFIGAIELLQVDGSDAACDTMWAVCPICGDTYKAGVAPANCELCGSSGDNFLEL